MKKDQREIERRLLEDELEREEHEATIEALIKFRDEADAAIAAEDEAQSPEARSQPISTKEVVAIINEEVDTRTPTRSRVFWSSKHSC